MLTCALKTQVNESNIIYFFVEMCSLNLIFEFVINKMHKTWGNIFTFEFLFPKNTN